MATRPLTVLHIADDAAQRESLHQQLTQRGHTVHSAHDGTSGLGFLQHTCVDVVLCDLHLPRLSGFEVISRAQAQCPDLPFVILTSRGSIELAVQAIQQGAYRFVTKPFSVEEIEMTMHQAVEQVHMRRRLQQSERRLSLLMATVPDVIYSLDPLANFVSVSAAGERILGYNAEEMIGKPVLALVHPDDVERVRDGMLADIRKQEDSVRRVEFRMVTAAGETRDFEVSRQMVFEAGQLVRNDGIARDVTDRKQLERQVLKQTAALKQTNAELQAIFDTANAAIVMVNNEGSITAANRAVGAYLDLDEHALVDTSFDELLERIADNYKHPDQFRDLVARLKAQPDAQQFRGIDHGLFHERALELRSPTGTFVVLFSLCVADATEHCIGRMWLWSDITKIKQADDRLHTIVDVSPVPLVITRVDDGEILFANEPLARLVNMPLSEVVGQPAADFYADAEDRDRLVEILRTEGQVKDFEIRFKRADNSPFWTIVSLVLTELQGEAVILGGMYDIDDRKRMEEALRWERNYVSAILDTAGALVVVIDREGTIREFNRACQQVTGYSLDEVKGRRFWEVLLLPEEVDQVQTLFRSMTAGDFPIRHENHWLTKGGDTRRIAWSNTALTDAQGQVEYVVGTGIDITAMREALHKLEQANRELNEKQAQLVRSEKMASLGMLVAGIAHELNTPIGAVNSMHQTLVRSTEKLKHMLEADFPAQLARSRKLRLILQGLDDANKVIESGSSRVTTIVRRLKSFARLDEAELKKVDIHEGLEDTLTIIHHELKHKVEVVRKYGDLPQAACYPGPLNQVFLNLLINANQAIEQRGTITLTTCHDEAHVYVEVADTGSGISADKVERIFDPGFTTKGVGVGTGLGLSICYQILQDHHGEIRVQSEPGKGSAFTVVLPRDLEEILGVSL